MSIDTDEGLPETAPMQDCPPGPPHGPALTVQTWGDRLVFYHAEGDDVVSVAQTDAWIESSVYVDTEKCA